MTRETFAKLLAAAKGARDTLGGIPEDLRVPGIRQGEISRALARLDIAIKQAEGGKTE